MIPTVDNYFASRLKKILRAILTSVDNKDTEPYLIDEALRGYSEVARAKFKKAYAIKNDKQALPIDVWFSYPDVTSQTKACYVITRGSNEEDSELGGIGNQTGGSRNWGRNASGEDVANETGVLAKDDIGYYIQTNAPILEMIHVEELDGTALDYTNFELGSNKFRLNNTVLTDTYLGYPFHISYIVQDTGSHKDYAGITIGYAMKEEVVISALSDNADTTRELDSLLKFILIYMRDSSKESSYYQIPSIHSDALGVPDFGNNADSNIYVINTTVTYETTYQVSKDSATRINNILFSLKPDNRKEVKYD